MHAKKILLTGLPILAVIAAIVLIGSGERIKLIAEDYIDVVDRVVSDLAQTKIVAKLQPGEEMPVLSYVDLKHYIVPEIKLRDGKRGYVIVGKFRLKREPLWSSLDSPITFSC